MGGEPPNRVDLDDVDRETERAGLLGKSASHRAVADDSELTPGEVQAGALTDGFERDACHAEAPVDGVAQARVMGVDHGDRCGQQFLRALDGRACGEDGAPEPVARVVGGLTQQFGGGVDQQVGTVAQDLAVAVDRRADGEDVDAATP